MSKRIALINDLSGLGRCSLMASIPVMSVMGTSPCPLPTAILSNQTGYDSYYYDDYTDKMDYFIEEWQKAGVTFDGIYTGFLGSLKQVDKILRFHDIFKTQKTMVFMDPILGDHGKAYPFFSKEHLARVKELTFRADVITPNLTECTLLVETPFEKIYEKHDHPDYLKYIADMAAPLLGKNIRTIAITGIIYQGPNDEKPSYYNLIVDQNGMDFVSSPVLGGSYSGTGDLFASVLCAGMVKGLPAIECAKKAVRFLHASIEDTVKHQIPGKEGINFEPYLSMLL